MNYYKESIFMESEIERERERPLAFEEVEKSWVALEWILRASIISSLRRMFSRLLHSYSVSFWEDTIGELRELNTDAHYVFVCVRDREGLAIFGGTERQEKL